MTAGRKSSKDRLSSAFSLGFYSKKSLIKGQFKNRPTRTKKGLCFKGNARVHCGGKSCKNLAEKFIYGKKNDFFLQKSQFLAG